MRFENKEPSIFASGDKFPFTCTCCGNCCKNNRDTVMMTAYDLFRASAHLGIETSEALMQYVEPAPMPFGIPIMMLKTEGPDDACIFYKDGGCLIQPAKPIICKLYPMNIEPDGKGGLLYILASTYQKHFYGPLRSAKSWIKANLSDEMREFMLLYWESLERIAPLVRAVVRDPDATLPKDLLYQFLLYTYAFYEMDKPVLDQYRRNVGRLEQSFAAHLLDMAEI